MATKLEYIVRRTGGNIFSDHTPQSQLRREVKAGMERLWDKGPYSLKWPDKDQWGPPRTKEEVLDIVENRVAAKLPDGKRLFIDLVDPKDDVKRLTVRKVLMSEGSVVLTTALAQLGDDYNWFSEGPERFDCSGLTKFCYNVVDYYLPHSADQQMKLPGVRQFTDRSKLKDGDLVGYQTGGRPYLTFDHIGIADSPGMVVDASTSYDMVVHRPIDSNPVKAFGRVLAVNGPL